MLFNSAEFLFAFLPIALLGFYLASRLGRLAATIWLALASLYFYQDWKPEYLAIILVSIGLNFAAGRGLAPGALASDGARRALLTVVVGLNLAALAYYKYTHFVLDNVAALTGAEFSIAPIVLPLAISFFTFQQIAFLVDSYRGLCSEYSFASYCLFVTFFPQLIAGPIVHHSEMLPQFEDDETARPRLDRFVIGLTILGIGLFKKVVIADGVAPYSTSVFAIADGGDPVGLVQAWTGALAYTLQIYFDFSGYSDMAIGAARLFGIRLPVNFYSPYKSANMIEFWRRWHMTLSRFLRDYVYIALGGNRKGSTRRYANLMATMLLGGIWHGAGWNFLIWGGLHGSYLVVNHGWRLLVRPRLAPALVEGGAYRLASWAITFLAVVVGWIFFRAETLEGALRVLGGLVGQGSATVASLPLGPLPAAGLAVALAIAVLLPNTVEWMRTYDPVVDPPSEPSGPIGPRFAWRPTPVWVIAVGAIACFALLHLGQVSEFLYFQF